MDHTALALTIVAMGVVTYLPRLLPVWLLASRSLPKPVAAWLRYVPVAVLAAMLAPLLVVADGSIALGFDNLFLWAALPTFVVAWRRRGLVAPVLVGMAIIALARLVR